MGASGRKNSLPGLGEVPITLGAGNTRNGIEHLWRNHKEMFADPEQAIKVLQETLGNENCRVVVSLKRAVEEQHVSGKKVKVPICLKRIVLHNPSTQSYCVMIWDGKELKLVSWNNAGLIDKAIAENRATNGEREGLMQLDLATFLPICPKKIHFPFDKSTFLW